MRFRHYLSIMLAFAVVAGVAGTVFLRASDELGAMEVMAIAGGVEIHRGNSVIPVGSSPESLDPQDVVVTDGKGFARLELEEGRKVLLQTKTRLRIRSTDAVEPQEGSILATADDAPTSVLFDDVTARFSSATFRLDRGFGSARAASYAGPVHLQSRGEPRLELTKLMQVEVAAGDLPERAVPYRLSMRDVWDDRFLHDVVTLTRDLDLLANGFARQVVDSRPGLDYFSGIARSNVKFMKPYLSRPVADLLVAFTIADNDPDASLESSFESAFEYLDEGASYGVAATLLDVNPKALVAQLEQMIVDTGAVAADGGAGEASFVLGSGASSDGSGTTDDQDGSGDQTVSGNVEGGDTGEVPDCSNVVDCGVKDIQDEIPPGPGPSEPEEEEDPPDTSPITGGGSLLDGGLLGGK